MDEILGKINAFVTAARAKAADAVAKGADVLDAYAAWLRGLSVAVAGAQASSPATLAADAALAIHRDLDGVTVLAAAASGAQAAPWGGGSRVLKLITLIKQVVDALSAP